MDDAATSAFLERLAEGHTVVHAASKAKVARSSAYARRESDEGFRAAWDEALEAGIQVLEEEARRRAYEGVDEPIVYQGVVTDTVKKFSDTLLIFLLKAKRPAVYRDRLQHEHSGPSGGPVRVDHELGSDTARTVLRELVDRGVIRPGNAAAAEPADDEVHSA